MRERRTRVRQGEMNQGEWGERWRGGCARRTREGLGRGLGRAGQVGVRQRAKQGWGEGTREGKGRKLREGWGGAGKENGWQGDQHEGGEDQGEAGRGEPGRVRGGVGERTREGGAR
jgi:hypothetical protein